MGMKNRRETQDMEDVLDLYSGRISLKLKSIVYFKVVLATQHVLNVVFKRFLPFGSAQDRHKNQDLPTGRAGTRYKT